ncbi:MAG: hypothetical protein LBD55_08595 [Treponema sp.]|jgi:hypothetical protein|nr:hypothetical protein [Treponema sp.]
MRKRFCILWLICAVRIIGSQEQMDNPGADAPYLIPQTVFVGDRARLVIPLGSGFHDSESIVISKPEELPVSKDLLIHRIELERRGGNARVFIDFTAFAPGSIALPSLKLPALEPFFLLSGGIAVPIASILEGGSPVLSDPVPPLALPGTTLLIYGAMAFLFLLLLLGIGVKFWSKDILAIWGMRLRRRRLIRLMRKFLRNVRNDLIDDAPGGIGEERILTCVSVEFRVFLSVFTGMHCRAMAAGEFIHVPPFAGSGHEACKTEDSEETSQTVLSGTFLRGLFLRCDTLRFRGTGIVRGELAGILDEIQQFIDALYQAEKKENPLWKTGSPRLAMPRPAGGGAYESMV